MGSWIPCPCGRSLHKNLFAGANVHVVVSDNFLNAIPDEETAGDAVSRIILNSDVLVRCPDCGRLAIESSETGAIRFYREEPGTGYDPQPR
jgi:hypothetical protein